MIRLLPECELARVDSKLKTWLGLSYTRTYVHNKYRLKHPSINFLIQGVSVHATWFKSLMSSPAAHWPGWRVEAVPATALARRSTMDVGDRVGDYQSSTYIGMGLD